MLKENTGGEREYKRYLDGLKASVLTAFYTPEPVTDAIARMLYNAGAVPVRALEPSAGTGLSWSICAVITKRPRSPASRKTR